MTLKVMKCKCTGVGIFAGYYGRADLTAQVLIDVHGEQCYATGDFARWDLTVGELVFIGRRDFQVKLRGQRIELGQIETSIMKISSIISGCIVVKHTQDGQEHLLAYVEIPSGRIETHHLREECLRRLPSHLVPSLFTRLERFPLTPNGKIDRKALPKLDSVTSALSLDEETGRMSQMEQRVHELWRVVLHIERIPLGISFFAVHGTSLSFMKLYNLYQSEFGVVPDIADCFRQANIRQHAQLLTEAASLKDGRHYQAWTSLNITHGNLTI